MKRLVCIIVLTLSLARAGAQRVVWTYVPPAGHVDVSPAVGDLFGDGRSDVVVGTTGGFVIALNARGKELWRQSIGDAVCIPPTIADVNADGALEVLAMNRKGRVACLNGRTGDVIWETALSAPPDWGATSLAVGDLYGDGATEIVTGTRDGTISCLRGTSGDLLWTRRGNIGPVTSPVIVDLYDDGQREVLVGSAKVSLLCLSSAGKELWRRSEGTGASPIVYKADVRSAPIILTGMGKSLCALNARGKTLWRLPMMREIDAGISVADADGDGRARVYAVDLAGHVVCATLQGRVKWTAEVQDRVRRSPSIGDIYGDGKMEILVAGYSHAIHVFDARGRLEVRVPLAGPCNGTATLAALGGALCVIVPVAQEPLSVFSWPGSRANARVLWPQYRRDAMRSGAVLPPQKPSRVGLTVDFGDTHAEFGIARAVISNPESRKLTVSIEAVRTGAKTTTVEVVSASPRIAARLPYAMPGTGPSTLRLTCRVSDGRRTIARRSSARYRNPLARGLTAAARRVAEIEKLLPKLGDRRGIEDRACFLAVKLAHLTATLSGRSPIGETERVVGKRQLHTLLSEANNLTRLTTCAARSNIAGRTVAVYSANPWAPFGGIDELVEGRATSSSLSASAFRGETQFAALNVFNMSSRPRTFRVEAAHLTQGARSVRAQPALRFFEVVDVPTERCDMSADALAPLGTANLLHVPAWSARQLWINVDSSLLAPGDWTSTIRLRSLDYAPVEARAPLTVTVWNARLPEKQALRNCGWGYVEGSMLKDYPADAVVDQVEHGTNVFVSTFAPKAEFDAKGDLTGPPDYTDHDAYVRKYASHGIILFCGYQGWLRGPAAEGSEVYRRAHLQWLRAWMKHLADLGVTYDGFALYPVDEPGLEPGRVDTYMRMAKLAREADPRILMYTDPVPSISETELGEMLPYVDIWCPNRTGLLLDPKNVAKLGIIKGSGKPVWTYECADNAKHQSPIGYYRAQAWLAWKYGLCGIGFWTYCTSPDDPWFMPSMRYDYLLVYPGNGVVSSKRWEAVRAGVQDYSMLVELRKKLANVSPSAKPEDVQEATRVLGERAAAIGGFCKLDDPTALPDGSILPAIRRREDARWAELQSVRQEIARLLDRL